MASMGLETPSLMRFLALHGKQQNAMVFRKRLGRLPHKVKNYATFSILEAPHVVSEEDRLGAIEGIPKTWFYRNKESLVVDEGSLEHTLAFIESEWNNAITEDNPYHGIIGFSQGGTLIGFICQYPEIFPGIESVICIGSPDNGLIDRSKIMDGYSNIKALHMAGATDTIVRD